MNLPIGVRLHEFPLKQLLQREVQQMGTYCISDALLHFSDSVDVDARGPLRGEDASRGELRDHSRDAEVLRAEWILGNELCKSSLCCRFVGVITLQGKLFFSHCHGVFDVESTREEVGYADEAHQIICKVTSR